MIRKGGVEGLGERVSVDLWEGNIRARWSKKSGSRNGSRGK